MRPDGLRSRACAAFDPDQRGTGRGPAPSTKKAASRNNEAALGTIAAKIGQKEEGPDITLPPIVASNHNVISQPLLASRISHYLALVNPQFRKNPGQFGGFRRHALQQFNTACKKPVNLFNLGASCYTRCPWSPLVDALEACPPLLLGMGPEFQAITFHQRFFQRFSRRRRRPWDFSRAKRA